MPIDVYTGQPGNGKSALMMERLIAESTKAERPIFAAGIDGIAPGLATVLEDAKKWNEVDPDQVGTCNCRAAEGPHAHAVPDGAIIFVDEAWRWFGHLHDASRQATPKHVLDLAEHRHRGLDFVWTTQQPNQIYPFVRGLIGSHHHVVRRFGTQFIDVFTWGELNEDVKSQGKRELATRDTRTLPSAVFDKYKSATLHTIKRKLPIKVLVLPVIIIATAIVAFFAYRAVKPENLTGGIASNGAALAEGQGAPTSATTGPGARPAITTAVEYAAAHTPLISGEPWTAPVFLGRAVTADPLVICMASKAGEDGNGDQKPGGCRCMTEQATVYVLADKECRFQARNGPRYNPYRQTAQQRPERATRDDSQESGAGRSSAETGPERAAPSPGGINGDDRQQTRYGGFRGTAPSAERSGG
jgi:zona occludens toxin (predicted ATPase)